MENKPLENRPNSGVLFMRQAQGNQPNMKGGINIDGVEYELAAWNKTAKNSGRAYISLKISKPYRQPDQQPAEEPSGGDDGDVPF